MTTSCPPPISETARTGQLLTVDHRPRVATENAGRNPVGTRPAASDHEARGELKITLCWVGVAVEARRLQVTLTVGRIVLLLRA
jgi:hypothetical protein